MKRVGFCVAFLALCALSALAAGEWHRTLPAGATTLLQPQDGTVAVRQASGHIIDDASCINYSVEKRSVNGGVPELLVRYRVMPRRGSFGSSPVCVWQPEKFYWAFADVRGTIHERYFALQRAHRRIFSGFRARWEWKEVFTNGIVPAAEDIVIQRVLTDSMLKK